MSDSLARITAAATFLTQNWPEPPQVLLVLGSGLGLVADELQDPVRVPYQAVPGFPETTVAGHQGCFVFGRWADRPLAIMQGRFHYYEGHDMETVVLPIRAFRQAGVKRLILTNAAGGTRRDMTPGDLMLIEDHLGLFAPSPLRGPNLAAFGPRFPDQSQVYDRAWLAQAQACAHSLGLAVRTGIYAWCRGPQFETPAEVRALTGLGADALGMSTVPEAIAAAHSGMKVLGLSCITNLAAGLLDQPLSHDDVMAVGNRAARRSRDLLQAILAALPEREDA